MPTAAHCPNSCGEAATPNYTFKLRDDGSGVEDDTGVSMPNDEVAYRYACDVVRELMDHREQRTRDWRLDVYEDHAKKLLEIAFASLDHTLDHLKLQERKLVELTSRRRRAVKDLCQTATFTVRESKSLVARSRGKPYLAVDRGQKVIRDKS